MIRVAVCGACGKMGTEVCRFIEKQDDMDLVGGVENVGHNSLGMPLGSGTVVDDVKAVMDRADVVVDFSVSTSVAGHAEACARSGRAFVTGVTGIGDADLARMAAAAAMVPVLHAPNFSVGIAVLARLVRSAAALLSSGWDTEIVEVHHRGKADAPSGTAKLLAGVIAECGNGTCFRHGRKDAVGPKPVGEVGISSVRTGDVVGEHIVIFGGTGERIVLSHKAESRVAFVAGVAAAVRFVYGRGAGWYSMADVLDH